MTFINSYPTPDTKGINGRWNDNLIDKEIVPKKYITMVSTKANTNIADSKTMNIKGIHCHASPIITAIRAPHGITAQEASSYPNHMMIGEKGADMILKDQKAFNIMQIA